MIKRLLHLQSPGVRVQLTLLYTAIFALLILLFSIIFYTTIKAFLASGVDSALQLRAQQIAGGISNENGKISILDVTGELPGLEASATPGAQGSSTSTGKSTDGTNGTKQYGVQSDVNVGVLVRILDVQGQTAYISPAFGDLPLPSASFTQPLHGIPWQGTVTTRSGKEVRVYSRTLTDNGVIFGVLQVGEPLAQLHATLKSIIIALLIITPFVLLLAAFGSYWLAKQAFKPIIQLTRIAREIKARDLDRRVPVPRTKDEVYDLALTLNEMIGRLNTAFIQQRRFVADASHELRTPVTVIRSVADVALEERLSPDEYVSALHDINAEAERLGRLINDLLTLARADEEQMPFDREPIRLDLLALDLTEAMKPLAMEREIDFHTQRLEIVTVHGDRARLIQVMMSLVDNALTYTNAGGIVRLNVEARGENACFSVQDTGIGIPPEDIPHIFERFYRADPARSRAAGGSGLGLAIAEWIVQAHGGSIAVESQVGQGSIFTVTLPLISSLPGNNHTNTFMHEPSTAAEI